MSLFDYPRIHFSGLCTLNPGTANNDDYSGSVTWPATNENLALIDSASVKPRTFGMSDADFRAWIQQPQTFAVTKAPNNDDPETGGPAPSGSQTTEIIPAEWNYYGDMQMNVTVPVTGVQTDPSLPMPPETQAALQALVGQKVYFQGNITDVNSEGSPPATQFFIQAPSFGLGQSILGGQPNKGACQWINFLRNVNMVADGGAGGYVFHVIEGAQRGLPGFDAPGVTGIVLRYYLYARHGGASANAEIAELYTEQKTNPAVLQITGTIAPYYGQELPRTGPAGRLLTSETLPIPVSGTYRNNLSGSGATTQIGLAPAVVNVAGNRVSLDAIASFPEVFSPVSGVDPWSDPDTYNPKFSFGPVALRLVTPDGRAAKVGPVDYTDTPGGNAKGWLFDFDVSNNPDAQALLADPTARFSLDHNTLGPVLQETEYYVTTPAQAIYGEQNGSTTAFRNQGEALEPASFDVLHLGKPVAAGGPPMTVWLYQTTPLGYSGSLTKLVENYVSGAPIPIPVTTSGTYLLTLGIGSEPLPPQTYADYIGPPFTTLTNRTTISLRVLPNEDYSSYLAGPASAPVGNDSLTFDVVYQNVLRTYDLLFPAMNAHFRLGDEAAVISSAGSILSRTDPSIWASTDYMPITRDLSDSRRTLLQAWCRKVLT